MTLAVAALPGDRYAPIVILPAPGPNLPPMNPAPKTAPALVPPARSKNPGIVPPWLQHPNSGVVPPWFRDIMLSGASLN